LADFFRQKDQEAIAAGKPTTNEEWVTFADDSHRTLLETTKTPMLDSQGKVTGVLGTARDITSHKALENKLRLAANVFEHANEGILITDSEAVIIDVNRAFCELLGYSREEMIGKNPRILKSGRQGYEFYNTMWDSILLEGYWKGEIWNKKKDGTLFPELLTISSVQSSSGEINQYVGILSDITQLKAHQEQLEHMAHYDVLTRLPNRVLSTVSQ